MEAVECLSTLVQTGDVRVAEFEMAPEARGALHYLSALSEQCFCLSGRLRAEVGGTKYSIQAGDSLHIPAGVEHRLANDVGTASRYLVVQYGGPYDFVSV